MEGDSLKIRFRIQNHWTKIAGTNGYSTSFMTNYLQDTLVADGVDRYSATTWYVFYPSALLNIEAQPLWRETSPNWEKGKKENE